MERPRELLETDSQLQEMWRQHLRSFPRASAVLDLDGTIIDDDYQMSSGPEALRRTIGALAARGISVGLDSDTPLAGLQEWYTRLGMNGLIVVERGAGIWSPEIAPMLADGEAVWLYPEVRKFYQAYNTELAHELEQYVLGLREQGQPLAFIPGNPVEWTLGGFPDGEAERNAQIRTTIQQLEGQTAVLFHSLRQASSCVIVKDVRSGRLVHPTSEAGQHIHDFLLASGAPGDLTGFFQSRWNRADLGPAWIDDSFAPYGVMITHPEADKKPTAMLRRAQALAEVLPADYPGLYPLYMVGNSGSDEVRMLADQTNLRTWDGQTTEQVEGQAAIAVVVAARDGRPRVAIYTAGVGNAGGSLRREVAGIAPNIAKQELTTGARELLEQLCPGSKSDQ